jgi:hypothetical protein
VSTIDFEAIRVKLNNVRGKRVVLQEKADNYNNRIDIIQKDKLALGLVLSGLDIESVRKDFQISQDLLKQTEVNNLSLKEREGSFEKMSRDMLMVSKAFDFFSQVIDEVVEKYLRSLEEILNVCYSEIYQNEDKSIKLDIVEKYNKKVLQLIILNKGEEEKLTENGGGVRVVLGTVLLIYYIL